jgi:hypothetical protein
MNNPIYYWFWMSVIIILTYLIIKSVPYNIESYYNYMLRIKNVHGFLSLDYSLFY